MSKGCLKCGTENSSDARFCRACGTKLEAPRAAEPPPEQACRACGHVNRASTRFCAKCGADQSPPIFVAAPIAAAATPRPPLSSLSAATRAGAPGKPIALWIGLGALAVALAAGGAWWVSQSRSPAPPSFDSAPPPSVTAARSPPAAASAPVATEPVETVVAPAVSPAVSKPLEPAGKEAIITEPSEKDLRATKDQAARDAKAKALREQRADAAARAEADLAARRRAEEARTRSATTPPPAPVPRAATPVLPPAQARTVQERCANANPLARGLCESRECMRREHAGEPVCQRIKAADDRRREQ